METQKVKSERTQCKYRLKKIHSLLKALEYSLVESQHSDQQMLMAIRLNKLKCESMTTQLKELEEENKQLLNVIQRSQELCTSRTPSCSSCSTMSMVHLQYKYEELLANQNGLLKILGMRISDIRRYQQENTKLKLEIEQLKQELQSHEDEIFRLSEKLKYLKTKKNNKIIKLQKERETLVLVHNQLVALLHKQCMERDDALLNQVKEASEPDRALLLQEIRKNNMLAYENFQRQQEIEYLQSVIKLKRYKSNETVSSVSKSIK